MKRAFLETVRIAAVLTVGIWLIALKHPGDWVVAVGVFVVLGLGMNFFSTLELERRKQGYAKERIREEYLPTFYYLAGLGGGRSAKTQHSLALITPDTLIVCRCEPAAYRKRLDAAWEHIKGELGRVRLWEIESVGVYVLNRDKVAKDRMESFLADAAVNLTIGKLLGAPSIGTIHMDAAVVLNRRELPPVLFGVSKSAGGGGPLSLAGSLFELVEVALPEGLPVVMECGSGTLELLRCFEDDPLPVRNAKKVAQAIGALAAQRSQATTPPPLRNRSSRG